MSIARSTAVFAASSRLRVALCAGLALLALQASPAAAAAAKRPVLTGMWDYQGRDAARGTVTAPPATPAVAARLAKRKAAEQGGFVRSVSNILCLPTGFPLMMQWKSPIQILEVPGRIVILSERDPGNDEPRTIYMDRPTPKEADPSWNGYSVGRWEGEVLVVETIGLSERAMLLGGVPRTRETKVVERFSVAEGGEVLIDEMTFTDPNTLTKPWTVALKYDRMPDDSERYEAVCEPDLEALKAVDLQSLKDIDVEAARMLDPNAQYNPGAR
jgi:hypothetical protein